LKVLVAGAGGMVGRAVSELCVAGGDQVFAYDHVALDISDADQVTKELAEVAPDAVINCAAWTSVDGCETDPIRSDAANAIGPRNLAAACRQSQAVFVTISTDYVFDGAKDGFYTQADEPRPISVYGTSKLRGEQEAQSVNPRTIVVRSGFIFGVGGRNFLSAIVNPISRGESVNAISDAWGTPTYAVHLARRLRELAELDAPGIYHVVNEGAGASYEEFAVAAAEQLGQDRSLVQGILSDTLNRPAPRPRNSRLKCLISAERGLAPLPSWQEGLREYLAKAGLLAR
jgi:dTDP-4-dehydrorhamnose reductase